jgi:S-(hydroxymethyl)glutathione dehydrogenase/alcohol dehydrogenase
MKAAVLETIDALLVIAEVELTPLKAGQVQVKMIASGICGAQLQEIAGLKGNAKFVPHLLGHEGVGIVEDIGAGVTRVKPGEKVILHWRKAEGIEAEFPKYLYKGKEISSGKVTTFSEQVIVSENRVTPVPQDTPNELAALLGCGLSTALGTINNEADVKFGESVMVVGVGGVGGNLIAAAKLAGAYPIIAVDVVQAKETFAKEMGAHLFINAKEQDLLTAITEAFDMKSVDVIVDTAANKQGTENAIPLLSGTGRYILVGQPKPGTSIELINAYHFFEGEGKLFRATQGGRFSPSTDIPRYVRMAKGGVLKTDGLITHRIKLDEINDAIDLVRSGNAGRILIEF